MDISFVYRGNSEVTQLYTLERQQWVPTPLVETFHFFSRPDNLQSLTPDWVGFEILSPSPILMVTGTLIDYRIRLLGLPIRWRTRIADWAPGIRFIDEQTRGPYRTWKHTHSFEALGQGTLITDRVEYMLPFGILGRTVHWLFIRSTIASIFDYRYEAIRTLFGATSQRPPHSSSA